MAEPKVLIGAPVFDGGAYATKAYLAGINTLAYKNAEYLLVDNSKTDSFYKDLKKQKVNIIRKFHDLKTPRERLVSGRNLLAKKVIEEGYDYFLSLEQDVIPPKDIIEKLMLHKKEIVSAVYYNCFKNSRGVKILQPILYRRTTEQEKKGILQNIDRFRQVNPQTYKFLEENNFNFDKLQKQLSQKEVLNKGLIEVSACGLGCVLIHRNILEKEKFKVNKDTESLDDVLFCNDVGKLNVKIYADTSIICRHMLKNKPWKWVQFKEESR